MSAGSWTAVYLLLGLGLVAGLYYALTQIMARQSRVNAELTRLERLSAEVAMNAEAILDRVDERIDQLNRLAEAVEAKARAAGTLAAAAQPQTGPEAAGPAAAVAAEPERSAGNTRPKPHKPRGQKAPGKEPVAVAEPARPNLQTETVPAPDPAADEPAPMQYRDVRTAVFALADEGKDAGEIALSLGLPRGEVQLILNLRGRKVTV